MLTRAHLRMRIGLWRDAEGTVVAAFQAAGRFTRDSQPDGLSRIHMYKLTIIHMMYMHSD